MDKNKNKNKTNVLRSSRIIKIKAIGDNTNSNYGLLTTFLENSQREALEALEALQNLLNSDIQILSGILEKTAMSTIEGLKGLLDRNMQLLRILKIKQPQQILIVVFNGPLSSYINKIIEKLSTFEATSDEKVVLKKLNDELSKPLSPLSDESVEIRRNLLLIVYYYSK